MNVFVIASILGSVAGAKFVREVAPAYGIPVILHTDHCAKKLLPWFDGMLAADEEYFKTTGEPLFSSHMLDLSEEPDDENIAICAQYFKRMSAMNMILEMEIGITGGVEDGVNNEGVGNDQLYTTPETVYSCHEALAPISTALVTSKSFSILRYPFAFVMFSTPWAPGGLCISKQSCKQASKTPSATACLGGGLFRT